MGAILWAILIPILIFCILNIIFYYYACEYRYSEDRLNSMLANYYIQNVKPRPDDEYSIYKVTFGRITQNQLVGKLYEENMMTRKTKDVKGLFYPVEMFPQI